MIYINRISYNLNYLFPWKILMSMNSSTQGLGIYNSHPSTGTKKKLYNNLINLSILQNVHENRKSIHYKHALCIKRE